MIFTLLANPLLPWVMSLIIVTTAFMLWQSYRFRIQHLIRALNEATRQIEEVDGQLNFKRRFPSIFKSLSDNPVIGSNWRAYAATIETAPVDPNILGYSRRPRESFNEGIATSAGLNLRFYQAVPNLLVGAGLLFTFLGLVGALHFAAAGVTAADITQAQVALGSLLATATFKFMTSIAGLASSIIFSWREKSMLARFEHAVSRFCTALEARMVPITTESLLAQALKEIRIQSLELSRLGKQAVAVLPQEFEGEIRQAVRESIERLRPMIDTAGKYLGALDKVIAEEVEASLTYRRNVETVPEIENELSVLRAEIDRLKRSAAVDLNNEGRSVSPVKAASTSSTSPRTERNGGWLSKIVGDRQKKTGEASDDGVSRKIRR
jgi:hypothetical protein